MKKDLIVSCISLLIFWLVNLSFALLKIHGDSVFSIKASIEAITFQAMFCVLVWFVSRINIKIRKSVRMPIIRALFWLWIAYPLLSEAVGMSHITSGDFIVAVLPYFCFYLNLLAPLFEGCPWFIYILVVYIIGISVYQISVLEFSSFIVTKLYKRNSNLKP